MRTLPTVLDTRLKLPIQAPSNNADPALDMWIKRPTTALTNSQFLEKQTVLTGTAITDVAVAACHPYVGRANTKIYIGYVDNGTAHVRYALSKTAMASHVWIDTGFAETASAVALEFDGIMPKDRKGRVEFVTEQLPWVFWINGGVVYGKVLGDASPVILASANATDVFAVRGMWSEVGGFDFGLIVFFIVSGQLYYRQLIGGAWMDAEYVSLVGGLDLTALTITSIAAMRTWDYRVVVQLRDSTGAMYELFTQFMGVGKQNVEHIEMTKVKAEGEIIPITFSDTAETEHIEVSDIAADGTLRRNISPAPSAVANINDGTGNWATLVQATLDNPCTPSSVADNNAAFSLTDGTHTYACSAALCSADGLTITLTFASFLSSSGNLTLSYTPGTITSPDLDMAAWVFEFTPTNLTKPDGYDYEHIEIFSITATGTLTALSYRSASGGDEHIEITGITATGTLTHINDL